MNILSSDSKLTYENSAVSPVIGVILMVAITVILAAVIGTMVMGLTNDVGETAPTANLQLSTEDNNGFIDFGDTDQIFSIAHNGGNAIKLTEVAIRVDHATFDSTEATLSGTIIDESEMTIEHSDNSIIDGGNITLSHTEFEDEKLSVGNVLFIEVKNQLTGSGAGYPFFYSSEGEVWSVQIIHNPSDSIIFEDSVHVS